VANKGENLLLKIRVTKNQGMHPSDGTPQNKATRKTNDIQRLEEHLRFWNGTYP